MHAFDDGGSQLRAKAMFGRFLQNDRRTEANCASSSMPGRPRLARSASMPPLSNKAIHFTRLPGRANDQRLCLNRKDNVRPPRTQRSGNQKLHSQREAGWGHIEPVLAPTV